MCSQCVCYVVAVSLPSPQASVFPPSVSPWLCRHGTRSSTGNSCLVLEVVLCFLASSTLVVFRNKSSPTPKDFSRCVCVCVGWCVCVGRCVSVCACMRLNRPVSWCRPIAVSSKSTQCLNMPILVRGTYLPVLSACDFGRVLVEVPTLTLVSMAGCQRLSSDVPYLGYVLFLCD